MKETEDLPASYMLFFQYPEINFCKIVIVLGMLFGECCFMLFRQFFVKPTFVANEFDSDSMFVFLVGGGVM